MIGYRRLKERLIEQRNDVVVFTFGRFQPPTIGHELLIRSTIKEAKKRRAEHRIYTSRTQDKKKNPLSTRDKIKYLRKFFPKANIVDDPKAVTAFEVCQQLSDEGIKNVIMVVGSDRVKEFKDGISKYIGPDGYDFDSFDVVSAGERDPEAEGLQGMSASKMRSSVARSDYESFRAGLPSGASDRDAYKLFDTLKKNMGIREEYLPESLSRTQMKMILKNRDAQDVLKDLAGQDHEMIAIAIAAIPEIEDMLSPMTDAKIDGLTNMIPTMNKKLGIKEEYGFPELDGQTSNNSPSGNDLQKKVSKKTLIEQTSDPKDIVIIALTKGEGEGAKDTVAKIEKSCKKRNITFHRVEVGEAFVVDDDLNDDKMTIYNFDGKGNDLEVEASKTCCFVRGGALVDISGRGLVKTLQEAGVFMINNMEAMILCQNKFATSIALQKRGILHPKTALVTNEESIDVAHKKIGGQFPVVVKTITGAEGIGVMIVESAASLKSVLQGLWKYEAEVLLQEYMKIDFDVRTLVLDGKIHAAVKRLKSNSKDFRTNKALGNDTKPYVLNEKEKKLILRAASMSGCYYCGVDHVIVNGQYYIIEVNGSPGSDADPYMGYFHKNGDKKITSEEMIDGVIDHVMDKDNWDNTKTVVGRIERVKIEGIKFKAKMDTGNGSYTAVHASNIKRLNDTRVSFVFGGQKFIKNIEQIKTITLSGGDEEKRFVVKMRIQFPNRKPYETMISLDDRSDNVYHVLIGRHDIKPNGFVVDVSKKFVISESKKNKYI